MLIQCAKLLMRCPLHPPTPKKIMWFESKQSPLGQPCANGSWASPAPELVRMCGEGASEGPGSRSGFSAPQSLGQSDDQRGPGHFLVPGKVALR